ncbi:MAG: DUF3231 family protein [Firmicutes bacterium]|nr:DUF3231 family protein [Bacillota bacterium]
MKIRTETLLTSAELGDLWTSYMFDSLLVCTLKSFLQHVEDPDISPLLKYTLKQSQKHVKWITDTFNQEQLPIPVGFTDKDVNLNAPRLYSDIFYPFYLEYLAKFGMTAYSLSLPLMARSDVREFTSNSIATSTEISNRVVEVLINKGLYVRPPYISVPKKVDFVNKKGFLGSWLGKQRPLLATEILNIFGNLRSNVVMHTFCLGLAQVAELKDVRKHLLKGKELATNHIEILSGIMRDEDIPASTNWDAGITDSVVAPFSEKLMMFHVTMVTTAAIIASYGASLAVTMRRDLVAAYTKLIAEMMAFAEDGINLMVDKGWLEQPPQNIDHVGLAAK